MPDHINLYSDHLDPLTERVLESMGTTIVAKLYWRERGGIIDNNKSRMDSDWDEAKKQVHEKMKKPLHLFLGELTYAQAKLFWYLRGSINDNNIKRIEDDYHDAKRHIGFLLAEMLLNHCVYENKDVECLDSIRRAYIDYLIAISMEEYMRIKAYLLWQDGDRIRDANKLRMDADYYRAMESVEQAMVNCKNRKPESFKGKECIEYIAEYFKSRDQEEMHTIKKAKMSSGERLKYDVSPQVREYVEAFYDLLKHAFVNATAPDKEEIYRIIKNYYRDYHVPNMLEFIMRCFLCTYVEQKERAS